jgi:hypothetical protein
MEFKNLFYNLELFGLDKNILKRLGFDIMNDLVLAFIYLFKNNIPH